MALRRWREILGGVWSKDDGGVRRVERHFLLWTDRDDDVFDAVDYVSTDPTGPQCVQYSVHPRDAGMIAKTATAEHWPELTTQGVFLVIVPYDSAAFQAGSTAENPSQSGNEEDPVDRPWNVKIEMVSFQRAAGLKDNTGAAVLNSAKTPLEAPELTRYRKQVTIDGWMPIWWDADFKAEFYGGTVNKYVFNDFTLGKARGAATCLCNKFDVTPVREKNDRFWRFTFGYIHKSDRWNPTQILDAGVYEKKAADKPPTIIVDQRTGSDVTAPVRLNGAGVPLNWDQNSVFLDFNFEVETDWANIWS